MKINFSSTTCRSILYLLRRTILNLLPAIYILFPDILLLENKFKQFCFPLRALKLSFFENNVKYLLRLTTETKLKARFGTRRKASLFTFKQYLVLAGVLATGWAAILNAHAGARAFYKFYCSQQSSVTENYSDKSLFFKL